MIDRTHDLPVTRQCQILDLARSTAYYKPRPVSPEDLALMRRIDELHMDYPFAGARMLRDFLKQELQIRRMPLFWLQWHMAKCAAGALTDAEKFLEQGYGEANEFERRTKKTFDRRQLDDRRAKFLMLRARKTTRVGGELFRDFKEAIELTNKTLRQDDPQHYPFETLADIVITYRDLGHHLDDGVKSLIAKSLDQLANYARKRVGMVPSGYQRDKAQSALANVGS